MGNRYYSEPIIDRVMRRVVKKRTRNGVCWIWTGALNEHGYGLVHRTRGRMERVHRVTYEHFVGSIPDGLPLDHCCPDGSNRACCNPDHLEPVTTAENNRRSYERNGLPTHCPHGHEFTPENTRQTPKQRVCRTCKRESDARRRERLRAERRGSK